MVSGVTGKTRCVPVCLEDHHRYGFARDDESDDQLGDDVEADLLVGDGLDHAYGQGEEGGDEEGQEEGYYRTCQSVSVDV